MGVGVEEALLLSFPLASAAAAASARFGLPRFFCPTAVALPFDGRSLVSPGPSLSGLCFAWKPQNIFVVTRQHKRGWGCSENVRFCPRQQIGGKGGKRSYGRMAMSSPRMTLVRTCFSPPRERSDANSKHLRAAHLVKVDDKIEVRQAPTRGRLSFLPNRVG